MEPALWADKLQAPEVHGFFDNDSNTVSYLVVDPAMKKAAIVDSVLDFDYASGTMSYEHADVIIAEVNARGLDLEWLIETHVHDYHLSAAPYIQQQLGGKIGISEHIATVQNVFSKIFNSGTEFERDGSQFDQLFTDGDSYQIGTIAAKAIHTPGHTPACMAHFIGMRCLLATRSLCLTGERRGLTSRVVMPAPCIAQSKRF